MQLPEITVEMVREAARVFLDRAYPGGAVPETVSERLDCLSGPDLPAVLRSESVEVEEGCDGPSGRYAFRLGSRAYPHVRLVLERCSGCDEFIFSVDTHDRHFLFGPEVSAETRHRFEAVQDQNRSLKADIERAWTEAGLPTFERFIRDSLSALRETAT